MKKQTGLLVLSILAGGLLLVAAGFVTLPLFLNLERGGPSPAPVEGGAARGPGGVGTDISGDSARPSRKTPVPSGRAPSPRKGTGWTVTGIVREGDGSPVAGALVEAYVKRRRGEDAPCLKASTGADGRYRIPMPIIGKTIRSSRGEASVAAMAWSARHRPCAWKYVPLPPDEASSGEIPLDLVLERGATLFGRVVDSRGAPVALARVAIRFCGGEAPRAPGPRTESRGGKTAERTGCPGNPQRAGAVPPEVVFSGSLGFYRFEIRRAGEYRLTASHFARGISRTLTLDLDPGTGGETPDLVLRDTGSLAGRVVYPGGTPCAGVTVTAYPERCVRLPSDQVWKSCWIGDDLEGRPSLPFGYAKTQGDGSFRLAGLEPGRHFIVVDGDESAPGCSFEGNRDLYRTGEEGILIVAPIHRVRLRIVDGEGEPVFGAGYVVKTRRGSKVLKMRDNVVSRVGEPILVGALPGDVMTFRAWAAGKKPAETAMTIEKSDYEKEVDLVLLSEKGAGFLEVSMAGPDGKGVRNFGGVLALLDGESPVERIRSSLEGKEKGISVPPGDYLLHLVPLDRGMAPPFPKVVSIAPGRITKVKFRAERGVPFSLTVRAPLEEGARPVRLVKAELRRAGEGGALLLDTLARSVRGLWTMYARSVVAGPGGRDAPSTSFLRPGVYTLHIEAEGFLPVDRVVTIPDRKGGNDLDLEVRLLPE